MSDQLCMYTVYDHPLDYPNDYVVRKCTLIEGEIVHDLKVLIVSKDLKIITEMLVGEMGLISLGRQPDDDPKILESYI